MRGDGLEGIVAAERELRDREASIYDAHREQDGYERRIDDAIVLAEFDLRPDHVVVDAGCGTGRQLGLFLEPGARVVGIDHSAASLEIARENVPSDMRERLELVQSDLRNLPLDSGSVDRIVLNGVLQHIPGDEHRQQAISELYRLLRPDGILVVLAYRWLGKVRRNRDGFYANGLYRHGFTAREMSHLFDDAGFANVRVGGAAIFPGLAERVGVSVETQRRLAFTALGRHAALYVVAVGRRPVHASV